MKENKLKKLDRINTKREKMHKIDTERKQILRKRQDA